MDREEFQKKYVNLRILKSVQEYLKEEGESSSAVYPIRVPDDLLFQVLKMKGAEKTDGLIHRIFRLGLTKWSEELYKDVFGSEKNLEEFIELIKEHNKK